MDDKQHFPIDDAFALIRQRDLARRWQKSVRTLQRWRNDKYGPASLQIGGTIMYRIADILAFEARQRTGCAAE